MREELLKKKELLEILEKEKNPGYANLATTKDLSKEVRADITDIEAELKEFMDTKLQEQGCWIWEHTGSVTDYQWVEFV